MFGTVEAVKAVSELYSPVAGEVVEVNDRLDKEPALVNTTPYGDGWMIKVRLKDAAEKDALMSADEYAATARRVGEDWGQTRICIVRTHRRVRHR